MYSAKSHRHRWTPAWLGCVCSIAISTACSTGNHNMALTASSSSSSKAQSGSTTPTCCEKKNTPNTTQRKTAAGHLDIPDVVLTNQHGKSVHVYRDLIRGRNVAINTFFTSCTTICPPLMATIAQVQKTLIQRGRQDISLISISVDPTTDTPTRLAAWSRNFDAQPGWTLLTGDKASVDKLLKAIHSFTPDAKDHSPMILVGNEHADVWKQVYGLAPAAKLADAILEIAGPTKSETPHREIATTVQHLPKPSTANAALEPQRTENVPARQYFTDVELIDHNGRTWRLYSDLMRGRTVVIDSFFSSCTGVCPVLNQKMTSIAKAFPEQMGKDLLLVSISVDPETDTPTRLYEYANSLHADPGWLFLTGSRENLKIALSKFGMYVANREDHSNLLMIGNDATGLWKKAFGLAPNDQLLDLVKEVLHDRSPNNAENGNAASRASRESAE